jgi:putative thioredoxin
MHRSPHVIDSGLDTFERDVLQASHTKPVVVDFWAAWCGPCRVLGPVLERLADEGDGTWTLVKVDTDANQPLAAQFGIRGIPAVKAFVDGKVVSEFTGALPEAQVRSWLEELLPRPADEAALKGLSLLESGRLAEAKEGLETAQALEAGHGLATIGLARVAIAEGDLELGRKLLTALAPSQREAWQDALKKAELDLRAATAGNPEDLLARLEADPEDHPARIALGFLEVGKQHHEAAFEHWLEVVRRAQGEVRDEARQAMVDAFDSLGRNELTDRWRSKLAMELYK